MSNDLSSSAALDLSFGAQAYLITKIHPWQDGNKRTSRLLSSYIQQYYDLPLGKLDKEDSGEYLQHLKTFKYDDDVAPFIGFMRDKYVVLLQQEIVAYQKAHEQKDLQKAVPSAALRAVNALVDARAPAPVAQHRRQQGLS
jgi:Fic family protein